MSNSSAPASASEAIEFLAYQSSKCIYAYDLALEHGFGIHAKGWKKAGLSGPQVIEMQTRSGAGLSITGRLSEGTSSEGSSSSFVLSAFTTLTGLAQMIPALTGLHEATALNRVVLQVPSITALDDSLSLSPSLASLGSILPIVPEFLAILASSSAQEAIDLASVAYASTGAHVVHIFDHFASAREVRKLTYPKEASKDSTRHSTLSPQRALAQAGYSLFDTFGPENAVNVVVVVNGVLAAAIKEILKGNDSTAVVVVRLVRPWDSAKFIAALPKSVKRAYVVDEVISTFTEGALYQDVLSTVFDTPGLSISVKSVRITPSDLQGYLGSPSNLRRLLSSSIQSLSIPSAELAAEPKAKKVAFFSTSDAALTSLPEQIAQPFLLTKSIDARLLASSDAFSKPGGITLSRLVLSPHTEDGSHADAPIDIIMPAGEGAVRATKGAPSLADFTAIIDPSLLKTHSVLRFAQFGSPVLVYTSWTADEFLANVPAIVQSLITERDLQLHLFDPAQAIPGVAGSDELQRALAHLAFLRLYVGGTASVDILERVSRAIVGSDVDGTPIAKIAQTVWDTLRSVVIPAPDHSAPTKNEDEEALRAFEFNAVSLSGFSDLVSGRERNGPIAAPWHEVAKHLLFPEAYTPYQPPDLSSPSPPDLTALRPELPDPTYLVTCSVNTRLTPTTYNRNVFHMEFDTTGTGLTYKLGEALGVHGWNDEEDIFEFCKWYGVDPNLIISVPLPASQGGGRGKQKVTRSVFQALQQQIDIFGRPPKSFYAALATYAKNHREQLALRFIAAPEGAATLKKLSEKDTVSYADVLALFPSARPGIEELAVIVEEIKERHYSIASAQSVVGNRVDLLIVTVDWVTPSGTPKYGQCTRYLANLKPGSQVTVSIKPSVMKLPPSDLQPIIMAGLGTGAAPFRAFIQHRSLLRSQGKPVGPMVYYFGSRHRSQEYLYGEEIEAYIKDGIITHAGLAFSRDSDSKVYIQHKMRQDGQYLAGLIAGTGATPENSGVFYLCGPTWPVPDVHEALVSALVQYSGQTVENASNFIEQLKEEERYVLEVY